MYYCGVRMQAEQHGKLLEAHYQEASMTSQFNCNPAAGVAGQPRCPAGLAARGHGVAAGGRGHAGAVGHGVDAAECAHGGGLPAHRVPGHALGARRAVVSARGVRGPAGAAVWGMQCMLFGTWWHKGSVCQAGCMRRQCRLAALRTFVPTLIGCPLAQVS